MNKFERDMQTELRFHLESLEAEYRAKGMSPEEARLAAKRAFGGVTQAAEAYREQGRMWGWLEAIARDLKIGFRSLRRTPALTAAIVATLALGIGANTAIFGIVRAVQFRPLPYKDPDRLMWIANYDGPDKAQSLEQLTYLNSTEVLMEDGEIARSVKAAYSSQPVSKLFGVPTAAGRDFLPEELARKGTIAPQGVALISHRMFTEQYAGDPAVVGRSVRMWARVFTITGVLPPDFRLPLPRYQQAQEEPDVIISEASGNSMVGRLRPGFTPQAAEGELRSLNKTRAFKPSVMPLHDYIVGNTRREVLVLWFAVGCVLLIACVNVTNLLLARSMTRTRETSVRAALGAGRWDLIRAALAETSLLSIAGGAIGMLMASGVLEYVSRLRNVGLPRLPDVRLDTNTILYAAACCVITALVACIGPLASVLRASLLPALRRSEGGSSPARGMQLFHGSLAVTQIAVALVLLSAAGLLLKSVYLGRSIASDADPRHVLMAQMNRVSPGMRERMNNPEWNPEVLRQIRLQPGVVAASFYLSGGMGLDMSIEGQARSSNPPVSGAIGPREYFAAAGYRLIAGRLFNESDQLAGSLLVNERFVRIFAPSFRQSREALGRRVFIKVQGKQEPAGTIVGIVNDLNLRSSGSLEPEMFRPFEQAPESWRANAASLIIRTRVEPAEVAGRIRAIFEAKRVSLVNVSTLEDRVIAAVATREFETALLATFAGVALVLSMIGIYGVLNYAVSQRTREIGVRMALGGSRPHVLKMVLKHGSRLAIVGVVFGLAGALALTKLMGAMLSGVAPDDPWVLTSVCATLLLIALLAAYVPARRATLVNPVDALRHD